MTNKALLIELLTEELPPKALQRLGDAFAQSIENDLKKLSLLVEGYQCRHFATPRRLAILIDKVLEQAPEQDFVEKLMPVKVGLDADGNATSALTKRLEAKGLSHLTVADLSQEPDGKQDFLFARGKAPGAILKNRIQEIVEHCITSLPIPKVMRYQLSDRSTTVRFVRPAHRLVVLHGDEVLPAQALGLNSDRVTEGHRFMGKATISLANAEEYEDRLASEGMVIAEYQKRKDMIEQELLKTAESLNTTIGDDPEVGSLLDEVNALVEHPSVYVGQFDREFLEVPQECLILTMRLNQKYFPLFDKATGKLDNRFLIVSNMHLADPRNIIEGNERVVRPRLADAQFFFDTDKKTPQSERVEQLANVVYHNRLGSQLQRTERVQRLAAAIAKQLGVDGSQAERAAYLAKADLTSLMVGEFPELQGVMAAYYAANEKDNDEVCEALAHQYDVRFNLDHDKKGLTALILFVAERIETLMGIWGIGSIPTGERDPYGLRRAALGIISAYEWLKQAKLEGVSGAQLDLPALLNESAGLFDAKSEINPNTAQEVYEFILERYRNQLQNAHSKGVIDAVLAVNPPLDQIPERIGAIEAFSQLEEAESLAAANKRIGNLLRRAEDELVELNESLLEDGAEKELFTVLQEVEPKATALFADKDFTGSMSLMATVRPAVDNFFNDVMVMADDAAVRANRLALLQRLHNTMNLIADISCLA